MNIKTEQDMVSFCEQANKPKKPFTIGMSSDEFSRIGFPIRAGLVANSSQSLTPTKYLNTLFTFLIYY